MSYARQLATIARTGIATVDTVADLRALNMEVYPERIRTLGCNAVGDGGGGEWIWDPNNTETDNIGTIVGNATAVGGFGRWLRIVEGDIYAEWFGGATCDAIQAANDWMREKGMSGKLILPRRVDWDKTVTIDAVAVVVEGRTADGSKNDSAKYLGCYINPKTIGPLLVFDRPTSPDYTRVANINQGLKNVAFLSDQATPTTCVHIKASDFFIIDHVRFESIYGTHIHITRSVKSNFQYIHSERAVLDAGQHVIFADGQGGATNEVFQGSTISHSSFEGSKGESYMISIEGSGNNACHWSDLIFENNPGFKGAANNLNTGGYISVTGGNSHLFDNLRISQSPASTSPALNLVGSGFIVRGARIGGEYPGGFLNFTGGQNSVSDIQASYTKPYIVPNSVYADFIASAGDFNKFHAIHVQQGGKVSIRGKSVAISDFSMRQPQTTTPFTLTNSDNCLITQVAVFGIASNIAPGTAKTAIELTNSSENTHLLDSKVIDWPGDKCYEVVGNFASVIGCSATQSDGIGFDIEGNFAKVVHNTVDNPLRNAVYNAFLIAGIQPVVVNNRAHIPTGDGFHITATTAIVENNVVWQGFKNGFFFATGVKPVKVSGNMVYNAGRDGAGYYGIRIQETNMQFLHVMNNFISGPDLDNGIHITGVTQGMITGNLITQVANPWQTTPLTNSERSLNIPPAP